MLRTDDDVGFVAVGGVKPEVSVGAFKLLVDIWANIHVDDVCFGVVAGTNTAKTIFCRVFFFVHQDSDGLAVVVVVTPVAINERADLVIFVDSDGVPTVGD